MCHTKVILANEIQSIIIMLFKIFCEKNFQIGIFLTSRIQFLDFLKWRADMCYSRSTQKTADFTHNLAAACVQATELNSVVHTQYTNKPAGLCVKSLNLTNSSFSGAA